ncbi:MAG: transposase [Acholeplasmatales bacterium]|nr:transposase [Acholeplasmatales bacterium]
MLIPEDIKNVQRPAKTDVRFFNSNYYVYPYVSVWSKEKKKAIKKNLPYVGKIIFDDNLNKYVYQERQTPLLNNQLEIKGYGDFMFVDSLNKDLYKELTNKYGDIDGTKIYVYSLLRLLNNDVSNKLDFFYENSYISEVYKDVSISKNTVFDFIQKLGKHDNTNKEFLASRKKEYQVLIFDGTQITNQSLSNIAEFGRSVRKTNKTQVCEIRVFDTISKEPLYYEVLPGNVIDKTAFIQVLDRFDTKSSIIIVDKGFNTTQNIEYLKASNINYIVPYNDNSTKITKILEDNKYQKAFTYNGKNVMGIKVTKDDNIYYIFQDPFIEANQKSNYINKVASSKEGYDLKKMEKKEPKFGVIAFSSNLDYSIDELNIIFEHYKERWEIETMFKLEKSLLGNEVIRVHSTSSLLGIRFISQIEMIMYSRIYYKLKSLDLLKTFSTIDCLERLSKIYVLYKKGKWIPSITTKKNIEFMNKLGIL